MIVAGTDTPEALAMQLIAAEDTKFRMFSFINELNVELELLEAQTSTLQAELKHARAEAEQQHDKKIAARKVSDRNHQLSTADSRYKQLLGDIQRVAYIE